MHIVKNAGHYFPVFFKSLLHFYPFGNIPESNNANIFPFKFGVKGFNFGYNDRFIFAFKMYLVGFRILLGHVVPGPFLIFRGGNELQQVFPD